MKKLFLLFLFLMAFATGYAQPLTAAPTPPARNPGDVISLYNSGQYTTLVGAVWQHGTDVSIATNTTRFHSNMLLARLAFPPTNLSAMTYLHIDVYSETLNPIWFELAGNRVTKSTPLNSWVSLDIPLSEFVGLNLSSISFFDLNNPTGAVAPADNVYVDNVYFYKISCELPVPVFNAWTIPSKVTGDAAFTIPPATSDSSGAITYTSSNTAVATISGTTVTVVGAGTSTITANQAADATHCAGNTTTTFTVTAAGAPTVAAPTPPARNSWDVISLYSGQYSTLVGAGWQHGVDTPIASNTTRYLSNMLLARLAFPPTNISAMTHMHIDVYSATLNPMWFQLQGNSLTKSTPVNGWVSLDIPLSEYIGLNLTNISFFDLNNPTGANAPVDNVYVDNVYFYRAATLQPPTLGSFTVPTKAIGDPAFTLTAPTSNSAGAWTYTSSNTNVATISGNTVTIVNGGISTITATQAANGIYGSATKTAQLVVTPAPAPTPPARAAGDVISYYSGAYTPTATPTWSSNSANSDVALQGNNARFVSDFTFGQISFANKDVSGMTHIHIDVYSLDTTLLWLWINNQRKDLITVVNGWASIDIPLSQYSASGVNLTAVNIIKIENPQGAGTLRNMYVDNIYFWKPAAALINPTITGFGDISKLITDPSFPLTQPTSDSSGTFTYASSNTGVATISGNTVTIVGAGTSTITATQAITATHNSGSISATLTVTVPPLTTPAPTPPARNAWDVISCYSDAYTNITPTPTWGGNATISDVSLSGNATKFLENYVLGQTNFTNTNVSAMSTLHFDIHSRDYGTVWVRLNNVQYVATTPLNTWASFDIPLSAFTGAPLSAINNIQFVSPTGAVIPLKNIYIDNIYFYRAPTPEPPTITGFVVPAATAGDPAFTLTPPTSNSNGAWTYSSGNPSVATISGDTVTIVGGGTATITATQAATASYATGSTSAQFVVAFAPPTASPALYPRTPDRYVSMYTGSPTVYPTTIVAERAAWSSATMTSIPNGTNNCLKLENFGYLGLVNQGNTAFSVEGMTNLHLDVYLNAPLTGSPATSRIFVSLLYSTNQEQAFEKTNLVAGWNSINIDLSQYSNADLTQVYGIKLEQNTAGATQIYLDNVYFSNDCYTYYVDSDGDGYGDDDTGVYVCQILPEYAIVGGDCNDSNAAINPGHAEICYNNIDDNCDGFKSEGCAAVVVNMTPATTITNFSIALSAVPYTYPGASSLGYRFWIKNMTSGQEREVNMPTRFVTIPSDIRSYNTNYQLRVAAIINGEYLTLADGTTTVYAGNTITVISPSIQLVQLSATSCNSTLASIGSTISASPGPNALTYTFRIRLASDNSPTPTYGEVTTLGSRFVNSNSFIGMPLQYNTVYSVSVKYTFDNNDGLGVQESGWGAECTLTTPGIPVIGLSSPMCGSTLSSMNSTISANPALYAIQYRFRMRLSSSNPSLPESYSTSLPVNSRFTYMSALQQQFPLEYAKSYYVSVQYSITNNSVEQWSNYGPECLLSTPAVPFATIVGDCETGLTPASSSELIYSTTYAGASGYRFILQRYNEESELIYDQYEDRVTNNFSLSMFSGLESGQTYYLSVWVIMNGQPVDGGINPCEIDIPVSGKAVIASPFAAKAYPNPFASNFLIDVTTESKSAVNIKVYDMVGRLVEEQSVQVTDMKTSPIGNQFPSGVYNVIITQDNEVQTLRVVKR